MKSLQTCASSILTILLSFFFVVRFAHAGDTSDPVIKSKEMFDARRPLDQELKLGVADGFTFAPVGDCIISRPLSQYIQSDPEFAKAIKILKDSDATFGNLETTLIDMNAFQGYPYSWLADWTLVSNPAVATDL